jgi:outer membrane lipopolysaccharide assembly protein LptE/RlpB
VKRAQRAAAVFVLLLAPLALAGCGYSLAGRGTFLPEYIRVVGIPACINQGSTIFNIDNILTEQLQKEFSSHGHYRVLPSVTGVDAVLMCRIVSTSVSPTAVNNNNQASRYAFVITAAIEFKEVTTEKILWANPSLQVREEYDVTTASAANDPAAFFGQDQNSMGRMARTFGRTVVTSVLEAF